MRHQLLCANTPQIKPLATGQHCDGQFPNFRGGENELHMRRWLLQRFQQGIKGGDGEHVHFVNDVNLKSGRSGQITHPVQQFTDVVDTSARSGIHLQHVHIARISDSLAMLADSAGRNCRSTLAVSADAVQGSGNDSRCSCFTDAANTGQNKGMSNAIFTYCIGDSAHQSILAHQFAEFLGPILARQYLVDRVVHRRPP